MAGYWKGTATRRGFESQHDAVALIDADGNAQWLLTRTGFLAGQTVSWCPPTSAASRSSSDDVTGKSLARRGLTMRGIDAEVDGNALSGELRFRGDDYEFTLSSIGRVRPQRFAGHARRCVHAAHETILGEEVTLTVTIDASGQLNGSYSNGCVFNGVASIPDASHNMVQLRDRSRELRQPGQLEIVERHLLGTRRAALGRRRVLSQRRSGRPGSVRKASNASAIS